MCARLVREGVFGEMVSTERESSEIIEREYCSPMNVLFALQLEKEKKAHQTELSKLKSTHAASLVR